MHELKTWKNRFNVVIINVEHGVLLNNVIIWIDSVKDEDLILNGILNTITVILMSKKD